MIKQKREHGTWTEFFRPYLAGLGLMVEAVDVPCEWNIPDEVRVPPAMLCPLTRDMFIEPLVDPSGHVYERSEIMMWLERSQTSPLTRRPLNVYGLRRCHEMDALVRKFAEHHQLIINMLP